MRGWGGGWREKRQIKVKTRGVNPVNDSMLKMNQDKFSMLSATEDGWVYGENGLDTETSMAVVWLSLQLSRLRSSMVSLQMYSLKLRKVRSLYLRSQFDYERHSRFK